MPHVIQRRVDQQALRKMGMYLGIRNNWSQSPLDSSSISVLLFSSLLSPSLLDNFLHRARNKDANS